MRARLNQVSTPNPEFGVDFDASARAMHQSALKGSLMVHETAFSTPAASRKSLGATLFERNTMLKTLKRKIALVAVAGLGFGLVSTVPANAVAVTAITAFSVDAAGITGAVDVAANATEPTVYTRVGATITVKGLTFTGDTATAVWRVVTDSGEAATISTISTGVGATPAVIGTVTGTFTATAAMNGQKLRIQADDAVDGTYEVVSAVGVVLDVASGGTPASISYAQSTREVATSAADYTVNVTVKDANGANTRLLENDSIITVVSPQTGVAASQVDATAASATLIETEATANGASTYAVVLDGDGNEGGNTGSTIAGVTYTLESQLVTSGNAVGAVASSTYTRVSNTAGLTGSLTFTSDTDLTESTALTTVPNQATSSFYVFAKDSAGALIKGVTINLALSGVAGATSVTSDTTAQTGLTSARTATPTAAGTGVITASITTGTGSISKTLAVTSIGYGATAAAIANVSAAAVNGNGFVAGTALTGAWTASRTVTSINVTITGMDASKAAKVRAIATGAVGVKAAGIAAGTDAYVTADATGKIVVPITLTSAAADDTIVLRIAATGVANLGAAGGDLNATPITITFKDSAGALTTVPATATTSFVATGSTNTIAATVADQFSNPVLGGSFQITNTTVPSTVTAQAAAVVNVDASGKANLSAVIGSVAGTYAFTIKARNANGTQIGSDSVVTYVATADGAPGSVTLTGGGSEDGTGSYTVWVSPNGTVPNAGNDTADAILATDTTAAQKAAKYGNWVVITASVKNAAGTGVDNVKVEVTGTPGLYFKATAPAGTNKLSTLTATSVTTTAGGVATVYAVASKAGAHTVTLKVGSKTATATFSAATGIATTSVARKVTLSSTTVAVSGNAITQVTATVADEFGNPISGVDLAGTVTGVAGRFAGGSRSFAAKTDTAGQVIFELTGNASESGSGTLTVAGTEDDNDNEVAKFASADLSGNLTGLSKTATSSATAALTVTAASAAANPALDAVKSDVKAVSDTVATLSKAVTTIQSSVTELTTSFTAQIKSLSSAIAKISRAIAALSKRIK